MWMRMSMGGSKKQIMPQRLSDGAVNYSTSVPALHRAKAIFIEMSRGSGTPENSVHVGCTCTKTN